MDSLFFIDFNSINLNIQWFYSKYSYIYFLNKNYILYNFLIFILIIYPLISKYYLLNSLKNSINNIYLLIQKREFEFYYINEYFLYNIFF